MLSLTQGLGTQPPSAERRARSDPRRSRRSSSAPASPGPGASVLAALLVAMECPHLSSSVCIAPDSAKFPNGSPSSWCCSGECGPRRPATHPRPRLRRACRLGAAGGGRADSGSGAGKPGPVAGEGYSVRRAERRRAERRRRLLCFPWPDGPAGEGEAREGCEPAGATSAWGRRQAGTLACGSRPCAARQCRGAVVARVARSGGCGSGCPAPTRRPHVWPGPSCVPSSTGQEKRRSWGQLCLGCWARWGPSLPALAPLPFASPCAPATRPTPGGREPRPREVLRTREAEVRGFHQHGRGKFENRLRAKKAQKADGAAALEGRLALLFRSSWWVETALGFPSPCAGGQLLGLCNAFALLKHLNSFCRASWKPQCPLIVCSNDLGSHRPHCFDYFLVGPWCSR